LPRKGLERPATVDDDALEPVLIVDTNHLIDNPRARAGRDKAVSAAGRASRAA
jgi:hypothetical protein